MKEKTKSKYKKYTLISSDFRVCVTDGMWFISNCDIISTDIDESATYIFGIDGIEMNLYVRENGKQALKELTREAVCKHLELGNPVFGLYRFEFNGGIFELCEEKPNWADYDCGVEFKD